MNKIKTDTTRDELLSEQGKLLLERFYMIDGEKSPQDALARAAAAYCVDDIDEGLAQRIYDYVSKQWFMFSSPILSNAPAEGETSKGLPISCFLNKVHDSIDGLNAHTVETRWLSVKGGGVGGHWDGVRATSDKSPGPLPFIKTMDSDMTAYRQGSTRKGSYACYLDVSNPDIERFIDIRTPTGGDVNAKCFNLHIAVNLPDAFMKAVKAGDKWELKCPHTKEVKSVVEARELWHRILEIRYRTGEPYLNFIDEANRKLPQEMKDKGLKIHGSNLCVSGNTGILTKEFGELPINTLKDEEVHVWNGEQWSKTVVRKTGQDVTLMWVGFEDTNSLFVTPEHIFYLKHGSKVEALELKEGDVLESWVDPHTGKESTEVKVRKIVRGWGISDTFCVTEPLRNRAMFNGVVTGNCNEIHLPTSPDRTAVCCLSSVNLAKYDEWKDTNMVHDLIRFLDNVLEHFIINAPKELDRAVLSAISERSLGLGAMGFHSFLQDKGIPWESVMAITWNRIMFHDIKEKALEATRMLAIERGSCPDVRGVRNSHLLAIAPNANSSLLCNTSSSIEPIKSNAYTQRTRVGSHLIKNKALQKVLIGLGLDNEETWERITTHKGSIQSMDDIFNQEQMELFKTANELNQSWVVQHAADRQPVICQGQSVNLFFPKGENKAEFEKVHLEAWAKGLKGLYYVRTEKTYSGDSVNTKVVRKALKDGDNECLACEG